MSNSQELPAAPDLESIAAFLDGSAPLDGVWFGALHPTLPGAYWWRSMLKAALGAQRAAEARLAEFDAAIAAELPRVSHIEYDSHEICKHFAGEVRKRLAAQSTHQAEVSKSAVLIAALEDQRERAEAAVDRLAVEVAGLRADAERWRTLLSLDYPTVCTVENDCGDWIPIHPERITEVIDATIAASKE